MKRLLTWLAITPWVLFALVLLSLGPAEMAPGVVNALLGLGLVVAWLAATESPRATWWALGFAGVVFLLWGRLEPRQDRDWMPEHAVAPSVSIQGDELVVEGLRTFRWSEDGAEEAWTKASYDLGRLQGMDLVVSHFGEHEGIAHTLLSFRFAGGAVLAVSPEIRKEVGEDYDPLRGMFRNYELIYVLADERDVLHLRTHVRGERVYVHPIDVLPTTARRVLERIVAHVQRLERRPAWYHTLTASCATALAADIQEAADPPLQLDWRVLLPGFSDALAFDLGLIRTDADLETTLREDFADPARWTGGGDYSRAMRGRL
jgi:hypothetical protein